MANLKIIITGVVCILLSAILFFEYEQIFGVIGSKSDTMFYMQWFLAGIVIVSLFIVIIGLKKPSG